MRVASAFLELGPRAAVRAIIRASTFDGCYTRLLAVRDLASGFQLAWLPVADESARTAADVLVALFGTHGPPLVLKSDNGSAFIAGLVQTVLADWQVGHLLSPPIFLSTTAPARRGSAP